MIKYIGSKRLLVPRIVEIVQSLPDVRTVADLFSGTSRVGHALKGAGFRVLANDNASYAHAIATCYLCADAGAYAEQARAVLAELDAVEGRRGYFTRTFCEESRYFKPENGERIDAIRDAIEAHSDDPVLRAVLITSLLEAADRVDSTAGVQMAYLKDWSPRAKNRLTLRLPDLLERPEAGACEALCLDAIDAAAEIDDADLTYLDPPYNQHSYLGNYHVWETIALNDRPSWYGKACKRIDCKTRKSVFNSRPRAVEGFRSLLDAVRSRYILVSFNDEGYICREDMERMLGEHGRVRTWEIPFKRYIGAKIGIHGPDGSLVGKVSHVDNREHLYLVDRLAPVTELESSAPDVVPEGAAEVVVRPGAGVRKPGPVVPNTVPDSPSEVCDES